MYIAATSEGDNIDSVISERFEECKYLLIVNTDDLSIVAKKNEGEYSEEQLAYDVLEHDCEAIITGALIPKTFDILANACITRYSGIGYSVKMALGLMEKRNLDYLKNDEGTDTCSGTHHQKECNWSHHK